MSKIEKLKCFYSDGKEADIYFNIDNESFKECLQTFTKNRCKECLDPLTEEDYHGGNFEFWIKSEHSFLNKDANSDSQTKLKIEFNVVGISHKNCEVKKYYDQGKTDDLMLSPQEFLKGREHWITEDANNHILHVKFQGKEYTASVSKSRTQIFKGQKEMETIIINLVIGQIKLKILEEDNDVRLSGLDNTYDWARKLREQRKKDEKEQGKW